MADDAQALSPLSSTSATSDADYDVIYTAFMETGRGRWFLQEYARRNRNADTEVLLSTLERIEETIRSERASISFDRIKFDLHEMARAIVRTKAEIAAIRPTGDGRLGEAGAELGSIVKAAEAATHRVLQAAEQVQELAWTMRERGIDPAACDKLNAFATEIYLACEFQDLTGQRTGKIIQVLGFLEQRINAMVEIWGDDEAPPAERRPAPEMDQTDIDVVMAPPGTRVETAFPVNPAVIDHEPVERGTGIPDELADALDRKAGMPADGAAPPEPAAPATAAAWAEAEPVAEPAAQALVEPVETGLMGAEAAVAADAAPEREETARQEPEIDAPNVVEFAATDLAADEAPEEDLAAERLAADVLAAAAIDDLPDPEVEPAGPVEVDLTQADAAMAADGAPESEDAERLALAVEEPASDEAAAEDVSVETVATAAAGRLEAPIPDDIAAAALGIAPDHATAEAAEETAEAAPEAPEVSPFGAALEQALASVFGALSPAEAPDEAASEPAEMPSEPVGEAAPTEPAMDIAAVAIDATDTEAVEDHEAVASTPDEPAQDAAETVADAAEGAAPELVDIEALEAIDAFVIPPDQAVEATAPEEPAVAAEAQPDATLEGSGAAAEATVEPVEAMAEAPVADEAPTAEPAATEQVAEIASEMRALLADWPVTAAQEAPANAAPDEPAAPTEPVATEPKHFAADEPTAPESLAAAEPKDTEPVAAEPADTEPVLAEPEEPALEAAAPEPIAEPVAAAEEPPAGEPAFAEPFMLELWAAEIDELPSSDAAVETSQAPELDSDLFEEPAAAAPASLGIAVAEEPAGERAAPSDVVPTEQSEPARPEAIDNIASEIRALLAKWDVEPGATEPEAVAEMPGSADEETMAAEASAEDANEAEASDTAAPVEPPAAELGPIPTIEVTAASEPAEPTEPAEALREAAQADADHEGTGKDEELAALLFEPARPAVLDSDIVLAAADAPNVEPEADVADNADETTWTPLDGVLPDWNERPAAPAKAVEAAFLSAAAVSMTAMAEIAGTTAARPASDPLAPVKAMSDEERIALFS